MDHFGDQAAVVAVRARLDGCLDFLFPRWQELLCDADALYVMECRATAVRCPVGKMSNVDSNQCRLQEVKDSIGVECDAGAAADAHASI